ncbi:hypothetical protein GCM10027289_16420 [Tsukamurella serpentis]
MTVLVAGQDPAGAVAVAQRLGGHAAVVGADGALTPLGGRAAGSAAEQYSAAVYLLDSCVPADAVDLAALGRLRCAYPTVLAATGAEVYPDAAATTAESARRCGAEVHGVQPASGAGFEALSAALADPGPVQPPPAPARPGAQAGAGSAALERADRSAYLRTTIARLRAAALAEAAQDLRAHDVRELDLRVGGREQLAERLADTVARLELSLHGRLRAAYRGTFAGWPDPPEPAAPVLSRPDLPDAPAHRRRPEDAAVLLLGASAGLGIGRAVAAPLEALGALRWAAVPISLAVGLAAALWLLRVRRRSAAGSADRAWAEKATAAFRQRVEFDLAAALVAAESDAALRLARGPGTDRRPGASNGYGP